MSLFDDLRRGENFKCGVGATEEEITAAEKALGVRFTEDYRMFLSEFSYASWFGHFVCGISENTQYNVVDATLYERSVTHGGRKFPDYCIALDTDCIMFCEPSNNAGQIMTFMTGVTPEERFRWGDLWAFLRYKIG